MRKLNEIEQQVIDWQTKFPCDRWWREKHNVAFMSEAHKEVSFLDQLFEFYEDRLIREFQTTEAYKPNEGDYLSGKLNDQERVLSAKEEFEREFDSLINDPD